jgi:hypothetical protein
MTDDPAKMESVSHLHSSFNIIGPPNTTSSSGKTTFASIGDTGCTSHFFPLGTPVNNIRVATNPISISNPNGTTMMSTHTAEMFLPDLPTEAKTGHIVPELSSSPLLSIGQFCDAGCDVLFSAGDVFITLNNKIILQGTRTALSRLWIINVPIQPAVLQQQAMNTSTDPIEVPTPIEAP